MHAAIVFVRHVNRDTCKEMVVYRCQRRLADSVKILRWRVLTTRRWDDALQYEDENEKENATERSRRRTGRRRTASTRLEQRSTVLAVTSSPHVQLLQPTCCRHVRSLITCHHHLHHWQRQPGRNTENSLINVLYKKQCSWCSCIWCTTQQHLKWPRGAQ